MSGWRAHGEEIQSASPKDTAWWHVPRYVLCSTTLNILLIHCRYAAPGRPTGSTKASRIPTPSWQPRLFTSQTLRELHETPLLDGPALDLVSLKPQVRAVSILGKMQHEPQYQCQNAAISFNLFECRPATTARDGAVRTANHHECKHSSWRTLLRKTKKLSRRMRMEVSAV